VTMFRRHRKLDDFTAEIDAHLEHEIARLREQGLSEEGARTTARRQFGNVTRTRERFYESHRWLWLDHLAQDVRYGLRMLRKSPGFTTVAVLTLALGIGANTYIFSVVDALLLRPFEFPDPSRIVALWERVPASGVQRNELSPANFLDWQAQNQVFDHIAAQDWWDANLGGVDRPEHLHGFRVTPDYFAALEAQPILGRAFLPDEGTPGKDHVAVLSYSLWRDHFGADPSIVGRAIVLNSTSYVVAGVMGPNFNYPSGAQVWAVLAFTPSEETYRAAHYLHGVAHLRSGLTLAQAQAEMSALAARLAQRFPQTNTGRSVNVEPLMESEVGQTRAPLIVMLVAVGLVLLIACANISNLLLARAGSRQRETAVRAALGASRSRLVWQSLVESLLLALLGGGLGVLFAFLCLRAQLIRVPPQLAVLITGWDKMAVNGPVLLFTLTLSLGTGFIFGLLPAFGVSRLNVNSSLKESSPGTGHGHRRGFLRKALVVSEVAVSLVLLATAGLMMKSFLLLEHVSPGFNSGNVVTMFLTLPKTKYTSNAQVTGFYDQLIERVRNLPGVQAAAVTNILPLGSMNSTSTIRIEGMPEPKPGEEPEANFRCVSNSYFQAMQIPILRGRAFSSVNSADGQPVVAVNEAFAARYWPKEDAVGKRIRFSGPLAEQPWQTVVAVVGNLRNRLDVPPSPEMYFPVSQHPENTMALVVRSGSDPRNLIEAIRGRVAALDHDLPVFDVMTVDDLRSVSLVAQRIGGTLMATFAAFALVLAATGLFGLIAYTVSERMHEIGLRMALGATPLEILRLVVGRGMMLVLVGLIAGLPLALGLGRAVSTLLYGVRPDDFATFAVVGFVLSAVALAACYVPARRAMRVDPLAALRHE
jgi:predicted permease